MFLCKHNLFLSMVAVVVVFNRQGSLAFSSSSSSSTSSSSKTTSTALKSSSSTATTDDDEISSTTNMGSSSTYTDSSTNASCKSKVLKSMLGEMTEKEFFDTVWQNKPMVFTRGFDMDDDISLTRRTTTLNYNNRPLFDKEKMDSFPLEETIEQGWNVLTALMDNAPLLDLNEKNLELPVIMLDGNVLPLEDVMRQYGRRQTLFSAYLDGCSVVQNHADLISPWIATICQDLQSVFPYVFAQTYLTPPFSQTLNPHADDRDVIVIQLLGQKEWNVYEDVPIPYPYPHEQVGKRPDLPVPPHVMNGPTSVSQTLRPGDMLYIPRGHVHQAFSSDDLSCHITVAIATFDWTLGASLHRLVQGILMQDRESRKSMLPLQSKQQLQDQIDRAMKLLQNEITVDGVERSLLSRTEQHLQLDEPIRDSLVQEYSQPAFQELQPPSRAGPQAAKRTTWTTKLRAATEEEKAAVNMTKKRPLYIRPDTRENMLPIVAQLKSRNKSCSVLELRSLSSDLESNPYVCDLTLLSFAKQAVALGALAIAED